VFLKFWKCSKYNWGYKIQSLLGGLKNIHPYYVDAMFDLKTYTVDEIWNALDVVKEQCPISYSSEKMSDYLNKRLYVPLTSDKVKDLFSKIEDQLTIIPSSDAFFSDKSHIDGIHSGKRFLIIANGISTKQRRREIESFIKSKDCIVIGLNYLDGMFSPDYHMFVNRKRFEKYVTSISKDSTLVVPSFFGKTYVEQFYKGSVIYPNMIQSNSIDESPIVNGTLNIKYLNIAISAILLAYQMGASEIYAVGMDGYVDESNKEILYFYNEDDVPEDKSISSVRYEKLSMELDRVNKFLVDRSIPFSIITPTSHKKYYKNIDWNGLL